MNLSSADIVPIVVHVGYSLMLGALLARDILWLRALLVCAQTCIGAYAWLKGVPSIAAWNGLFVVLNSLWVVRIIRERRAVELPGPLRALHEQHFSALTAPEFLRFWKEGRRTIVRGERLTTAGEYPESLFFLIHGAARITTRGALIAQLPAGYFVGEMSLLTGEPANADVDADGTVMTWSAASLRALPDTNPILWTKLQSVLGRDVVEKIKRSRPADRATSSPP